MLGGETVDRINNGEMITVSQIFFRCYKDCEIDFALKTKDEDGSQKDIYHERFSIPYDNYLRAWTFKGLESGTFVGDWNFAEKNNKPIAKVKIEVFDPKLREETERKEEEELRRFPFIE